MCLCSKRSQMMSKCGQIKKSVTQAQLSVSLVFLTYHSLTSSVTYDKTDARHHGKAKCCQ